MNLLGAALYDPAVAVSKATSALLAMTAFDTTNLRLTVTVPSHGMLRIKMVTTLTGATTVPTILLGCLNGATVVGRQTPLDFPGTMNAATQSCPCIADYIVTGLTPGSITLDAAYAVQVIVASTNIKYGGPNTNAGANAWGAFSFEIWDPQPMTTGLNGGVNVKQWNTTNVATPATAGIPDVNVKNINNIATTPVTTVKAVQGLTTADVVASVTGAVGSVTASVTVGTNNDKTGYALSSAGVQAIWDALTSALATVGSIGKLLVTNIDAAISSRSTFAGGAVSSVTNPVTVGTNNDKTGYSLSAAAIQAIWDALTTALTTAGSIGKLFVDNIDAKISSRSTFAGGAVSSVTNPVTVGTNNDKTGYGLSAAAVQAIWDALTSALTTVGSIGKLLVTNIDAAISSRLASGSYTTPPTVVAIRTEMDANSTKLAHLDIDTSTRLAAASYTAPDNADIVLIKAKTDNLPAAPAAVSDIPTAIQNADQLLKRDFSVVTGEASRSVLNALRFLRNKFSTTAHAGQVTVYKEDDTTEAFTKTVTTDATAAPIVEG